ncbi:MAG: peptide chain release factor-like protein [Elusimicrobiota bacterium]
MRFAVSGKKQKNLIDKMNRLGITEADLIEKFIRSSGPGGQKINKTSNCVYLKHLPTGIEVKCSRERSRSVNRYIARVNIASKIENLVLGRKSEEKKKIEKIKRQKRKRSKRAKEKILTDKHNRSEIKRKRAHVRVMSPEEYS